MFTKRLTYEDYDGNPRMEEFQFHLNRTELTDWLMVENGVTIDKIMENMAKKNDVKAMIDETKELLMRSYGRKSLDGRRFEKNDELLKDFMQTEAFSIIHMELSTDAEKLAEFISKILPSDLSKQLDEYMKENGGKIPDNLKDFVS